jgi:[histone H3]-lysine36 N-dimethyltransferase SETMAR
LQEDISLGLERLPISSQNLIDADFFPPPFQYTTTVRSKRNIDMFYSSCTCQDCSESCPCLLRMPNVSFPFTADDVLMQPNPLFECSKSCHCKKKCKIQFSNEYVSKRLQVFKTKEKGWGVRALEQIKQGTFICNYVGELLFQKEVSQRRCLSESNYILVVKEHVTHQGNPRTYRTIMDATYFGNISRFINHSCSANLLLIPVRSSSLVPTLAIFSAQDIVVGDELTLSYGMSCVSEEHENKKRKGPLRVSCLCGASNCVGFLPFEPE